MRISCQKDVKLHTVQFGYNFLTWQRLLDWLLMFVCRDFEPSHRPPPSWILIYGCRTAAPTLPPLLPREFTLWGLSSANLWFEKCVEWEIGGKACTLWPSYFCPAFGCCLTKHGLRPLKRDDRTWLCWIWSGVGVLGAKSQAIWGWLTVLMGKESWGKMGCVAEDRIFGYELFAVLSYVAKKAPGCQLRQGMAN